MAKYAQGYERKSSDTKNLITMASVIVGLVVLAVLFVFLYNKVLKKDPVTFKSEKYADYFLTDYSKLVDQVEGDYLIYVCSKTNCDSSTSPDNNMASVLKYIDKYEKDNTLMKLYLIDSDDFSDSSSENHEIVDEELGYEVSAGYLIYIDDGALTNTSTQIIKETKTVKAKLKALLDKKEW